MSSRAAAMPAEGYILRKIREALDVPEHGFSLFDGDGRMVLCNRWLAAHFALPAALTRPGTRMTDFFRFLAERGEFGPGEPRAQVGELLSRLDEGGNQRFDRVRPDGSIIEIEISHLPSGGHLALITDMTAQRTAEAALKNHMEDLQLSRAAMEQQAFEIAQLAEQLSAQKQAVEAEKQRSDYLAAHEVLTGLPNRRHLFDWLQGAVEGGRRASDRIALLFVDLDKFKQVNDRFGHERGDAHLVEVAERLRAAARHEDFVARLGGDEFAVIVGLQPGDSAEAVRRIAERFHRALQIRVVSPEAEIDTGASIGVAIYPDQAQSAGDLLARADAAMYRAKKAGGNRVVLYEEAPERTRIAS